MSRVVPDIRRTTVGLIDLARAFGRGEDEMAKKPGIGADGIAKRVAQLKAAGTDSAVFERVLAEITADKVIKANEIAEIATGYCLRKVKSRAQALEAINKRFVELRRQQNKDKIAEKARPW